MAQYTHTTGSTRVVQAKGDIEDVIFNIDVEDTPILSVIKRRNIVDIKPQDITDSLASVATSTFFGQDASFPSASDTTRALVYNWTQNFMTTAEVTRTQNAVAQYGMASELSYQEVKKLLEMKRTIEAFIVSDQARQEPTSANSRIGKMGGMSSIITTQAIAVSSFAQADYDAQMAEIAADGGRPRDAYMDGTRKIAVDAWTTTPTRFQNDIHTLDKTVNIYRSSLGEDVRMHWHYLMPQDLASSAAHFLLLQMDLWTFCQLYPIERVEQPDTGAGPSTGFRTQATILCPNEEANLQYY
jgi:hypothetical protein